MIVHFPSQENQLVPCRILFWEPDNLPSRFGLDTGKLREGGWIVTVPRDTAAAAVQLLHLQVTFVTTLLTEHK